MVFVQAPPELANQYDDDRVLRSYLRRALPPEVLASIEPSLREMGALAGGALYRFQHADRGKEPELTAWSPWGERIDRIELTPLWQEAEKLAAIHGVVAAAYERTHGAFSRVHQFALAYLFAPSTDVYTCPLAMTDGAAKTLLVSGNRALADRAVPHLTSRDPAQFWTSGQWMTESTGGSDVGRSETTAVKQGDGTYRLYGRKWFTSAATSQMALTLARPEGNPAGGHGLALFYVETRDENDRLANITVHRLKDKLGTRKVPTAELTLDGTPATLVGAPIGGTRAISPMLNITRTWNAICAASGMRRAVALARDYARRRTAFGSLLVDKPLHSSTLARLQAEAEGGFHLAFFVAELIGKEEAGELDDEGQALLRVLTPLAKLVTGKQAVAVASEVLECFGGAGYVEDTGLPVLLRDAQVLPIWEGTTNVLSLDVMRLLAKDEVPRALFALVDRCADEGSAARSAMIECFEFLRANLARPELLEGGARHVAMSLGRSVALALLEHHARFALATEKDVRPTLAARELALTVARAHVHEVAFSRALASDEPLAIEDARAHGLEVE